MYGRTRQPPKPIYGISKKITQQLTNPSYDCAPICECNVDLFVLLTNLSNVVQKTNNMVIELFPTVSVKAILVADMPATAKMSTTAYIWLALHQYFEKIYSGVTFDVNNRAHLAILKDAYLMHGFPWENDPILRIYPI